jgi:hypothetical protein
MLRTGTEALHPVRPPSHLLRGALEHGLDDVLLIRRQVPRDLRTEGKARTVQRRH